MTAAAPVLAIDLGGSKIMVALVDKGRVLDRVETPTDRDASATGWLAQIRTLAAPYARQFDRAGMTVTGLVERGHWSALNPGTLNIPPRFPLQTSAQAVLGVPVALANDAQAAAWGEYLHGAGAGRDLVFLTVSTGIGGGIVSGGRLLTGRSGLAGNFGQMQPQPEGEGLFEDAASGRGIAQAALAQGHAADARAVFDAAKAGAPWAETLIAASAARLARLCCNIQLTFDPEVIVIGGGVGLAPGYLERIATLVCDLPPVTRPTLAHAALGAEAGVIGIAALAQITNPNREE